MIDIMYAANREDGNMDKEQQELPEESYETRFLQRTVKHIVLVNKYAAKLNRSYPDHDADKFGRLFHGFKLWYKDKTKEEADELNACTLEHIKRNSHHPEYWTDVDLSAFSRTNPAKGLVINMPEEDMIEMCCDWCAMSEELGGSPIDWAKQNIGTRWIFNQQQELFIYTILELLWEKL